MVEDKALKLRECLAFYDSALFTETQLSAVYGDGKVFVDAVPRTSYQAVSAAYLQAKEVPGFDLKLFVDENFIIPEQVSVVSTKIYESVKDYIESTWDILYRKADINQPDSNLISLPFEYIVPGGRFREIYYWDSYFTAHGLVSTGREKLARSMLKNFIFLVNTTGHIPNGNRTYFQTRSQPPVLSLFCELIVDGKDDELFHEALGAMERELEFWTGGGNPREIELANGMKLCRYWDSENTPRPESYKEDVELYHELAEGDVRRKALYRNLRAAAESGYDFSSRWLSESHDLGSIRTTDVIPVDLNALVFNLQKTLAKWYKLIGNFEKAENFAQLAEQRSIAINHFLFDKERQTYVDFSISEDKKLDLLSAAIVVPLFVGQASQTQAGAVTQIVEKFLLKDGGIVTSTVESGQQWDSPNGWAPIQLFAFEGLKNYGFEKLANKVRDRWLNCVEINFSEQRCLLEKYDVVNVGQIAGGGEYQVQFGFGWTNGVTQYFYDSLKQ